ncbi:MAG: response regulator transcription factor, partial [Anaerolineae bacterium]
MIGDAIDADGLLAAASQLRPDVILVGMTVLAARWSKAVRWTSNGPAVPLVAALPELHDGYLAVAAWAEAKGYVLEDASPSELTDALGSAAAGQSFCRNGDRQRALRWEEEVGRPWRSLTDREREVFHLLVRGMGNPAIADALTLAPKTVEHHVGRILGKLGLASRAMVASWYYDQFPAILR